MRREYRGMGINRWHGDCRRIFMKQPPQLVPESLSTATRNKRMQAYLESTRGELALALH